MPKGNAQPPTPRGKPNVGRLHTLTSVRQEMARLYREARRGKETVADAGRLAYILSLISRIIEGSDLERRLEALERKLEERNAS
jgi:hypothetical protein